MAAGSGGGHVGRRLGTLRGTLGLAIAALLGVAGCGGAIPDPYAVLARTANYDRIQVSLGFTVDVAAQTDPNFPDVQMPATSINVDPSLITATADIPTRWVNKASGRLVTLRIEGTRIETPVATVAVVLQVAEPGPEITFEAPRAFTDVNLADLIGNPFPGVGVGGGGGAVATMSPAEQEIIDDILDEVGEGLEDQLPTTP